MKLKSKIISSIIAVAMLASAIMPAAVFATDNLVMPRATGTPTWEFQLGNSGLAPAGFEAPGANGGLVIYDEPHELNYAQGYNLIADSATGAISGDLSAAATHVQSIADSDNSAASGEGANASFVLYGTVANVTAVDKVKVTRYWDSDTLEYSSDTYSTTDYFKYDSSSTTAYFKLGNFFTRKVDGEWYRIGDVLKLKVELLDSSSAMQATSDYYIDFSGVTGIEKKERSGSLTLTNEALGPVLGNGINGDDPKELCHTNGYALCCTFDEPTGSFKLTGNITQTMIDNATDFGTSKIAAVFYWSFDLPAGYTPDSVVIETTRDGYIAGKTTETLSPTAGNGYCCIKDQRIYVKVAFYLGEKVGDSWYKLAEKVNIDMRVKKDGDTYLTSINNFDFTGVTGLGGKKPMKPNPNKPVIVTPPTENTVGVAGEALTVAALDDALSIVKADTTIANASDYDTIALTTQPIAEDLADPAQAAIRAQAGSGAKVSFLDISLLAKDDAGIVADHKITSVTEDIPITLELPVALRGKTNYQVIRYHDTIATALHTTVLGNNISFRTNLFSTYAIAYSNAAGGNVGGGYWYGGWSGSSDITVSFNSNGGSAINPVKMSAGGTIDPYKYIPTKSGYAFGGWYTDSGLTKVVNADTRFDANTTLYVRWLEESVTAPAPSAPTTGSTSAGATSNPQTGDSWFANLFNF